MVNKDGWIDKLTSLAKFSRNVFLLCLNRLGVKRLLALHVLVFIFISQSVIATPASSPKIGIVIARTSFDNKWEITQMSAFAWTGLVNLAGIPYDCLVLENLEQAGLSKYDLLILGQCRYIDDKFYPRVVELIGNYLKHGGNLIIDGPLGLYDQAGRQRQKRQLDELLGIKQDGLQGNTDFRIKIINNKSYITKLFQDSEYLTQNLADGLRISTFNEQGNVLLASSNDQANLPFLSIRESGGSRMALVNELSTWAGAASFFRNRPPQGFYPNRIPDVMIRTIYWAIYGEIDQPFPALQLSNANLTAIVRLDADESYLPDFQETTISYLNDLAKTTGVVSVYGWVSGLAAKAGWETLAALGTNLEASGGEIATHSKTHFRSATLSDSLAAVELDSSIAEIESGMRRTGRDIGKVEFFINPHTTIHLTEYGKIAERFSLFMTHGFDEPVPLGYGNMTWFTGKNRNLVVVKDTPPSDWLWFYAPDWNYSTAQIVNYEDAIFDHLFRNISRGVLFDQMWHDYSIHVSEEAQENSWLSRLLNFFSKEKKIKNTNRLPLYETLKEKFAANDIYCPEPVELGHKLRAMAQCNYAWKTSGSIVELTLDLHDMDLDSAASYVGGLGIRIENTVKKIRSVFINDQPHFGFNERVVILPDLALPVTKIKITLDDQASRKPHLTYISKRMASIRKRGEYLATTILTKSRARFSFYVEEPFILLNADWQEWNRQGDNGLNGYVTSDRELKLRMLKRHDFTVTQSNVTFLSLTENESGILLTLGQCTELTGKIRFICSREPLAVHLNSQNLILTRQNHTCELILPEFTNGENLVISF